MDLKWNPITRNLEFNKDGSLAVIENPSTQNGGIILEARCMNVNQPQAGIGFNSQVIGGNLGNVALELNRWNAQIAADGGRSRWVRLPNAPNQQFTFQADVNYLI